jgi:hypothetical protein
VSATEGPELGVQFVQRTGFITITVCGSLIIVLGYRITELVGWLQARFCSARALRRQEWTQMELPQLMRDSLKRYNDAAWECRDTSVPAVMEWVRHLNESLFENGGGQGL